MCDVHDKYKICAQFGAIFLVIYSLLFQYKNICSDLNKTKKNHNKSI